MKRRLALPLLALLAIAALPAFAGANHGNSSSPNRDMVSGGGTLPAPPGVPPNNFAHNAKGDMFSAKGNIHFHERGGDFKINGDVLCVRAEGNRATILYEDTKGTRPARETAGGIIWVEDNGSSSSSAPDRENNNRLSRQQLDQQLAAGCPHPDANTFLVPLLNGNLTVHDGA